MRGNSFSGRRAVTRIAAVLGILALGVGAGFAGSRLAAPVESVAAPIATEILPVIAPVSRAADAAPEDSDGDPDTFDVSPAVGHADVPLGDAARDEVAAAALALGTVDDPATVYDLPVLGGEGDPCASEADAPADCPDGIRGAIFSLTGASLAIFPVFNPQLPSAGNLGVVCPASEPAIDPATRDRMRLGVGSTAPAASMTVVYHPIGQPDAARELTTETSADERAAWERVSGSIRPLISHCFTLDELDPGLRYQVTVTAEGDAGATDTETRYFGLEQELTRPPVRVVPLLQNLVFLSVPHRDRQSVSVKALSFDDEGGPTECGEEEETGLYNLKPLTEPSTVSIDIEHLERNGYQSAFTKRTGQAFFLEEGSTTMLCLFVYDTDRPSWSWDTAEYRYSVVVQPPDVTVPSVTLTDISLHSSLHSDGDLYIRGWDRSRSNCSGRGFTFASVEAFFGSGDFEQPICQWGHLSGGNGVRTGDVILQATVGENKNNVLLPLSSIACTGVCDLPASATYQLLLPTVRDASGLCGSSFGDCEPPTSEVAAGTATFRVDWHQGFQNGQSEWAVGEIAESTPETVVAVRAQLNTRKVLKEVSDASGFHLEFDLEVDRPVRFSATLSGDCILPGTVTEVTGEYDSGTQRVRFANVCHGTDYRASVQLFDGDAVTSYGDGSPDGHWGVGVIRTTPIEKLLNFGYRVTDSDPGRNTSLLSPLELSVNGERINLGVRETGDCFYGDTLADFDTDKTAELAELVTVTVSVGMANGNGSPESDLYPVCTDADAGEQYTFQTTIPVADLNTVGVRIASPDDAPFEFVLSITERPR
ncbi:hypothetical protein ACX3O0_11700 [Homoserinimonas sp. A447]